MFFSFTQLKILIKVVFIFLFIFPALAQSGTPEISCDQTADINQLKTSVSAYANEVNIRYIKQLNKYLERQLVSTINCMQEQLLA